MTLAFLLIPWVFFTLIGILVCVITWGHESEDENLGWAHSAFIALMCLLAYKFAYILPEIKANPWVIAKYLGTYLFIGIIWAFAKWYFYLKNIFHYYQEKKDEYLNEINTDSKLSEEEKKLNLQERLQSHFDHNRKGLSIKVTEYTDKAEGNRSRKVPSKYQIIPPAASQNKSKIISWISHWPISMLWTLLNDPIKKLLNYIFECIKNVFQKMSNRIFKQAMQDFN